MQNALKRLAVTMMGAAILVVGGVGGHAAFAEPSNFPTNPEACVGNSSTTANVVYQSIDPSKFRSTQARADDGTPGRADSVAVIPQCVAGGEPRGHI